MSLDIAIFEQPEKNYIDYVALNLDEHTKLIELSQTLNLDLLIKISDYYSDMEYSIENFTDLNKELDSLLEHRDLDKNIKEFCERFKRLITKATRLNKKISIVAD